MGLTGPVLAAVLFAAFLHAAWNALVKSSSDKALDLTVLQLMGSALALPLVLWVGLPERAAWPYIATSITIHIGYYTALSGAYKHGDLGLTYPLMRGVAPLLVALSATVTLGEQLSALAWAGVLAISAGVLVLGHCKSTAAPKAIAFALANAVIIAAYTVVDALGVRAGGDPIQYVALLFLLDGWPFALLMYARRGHGVTHYARGRWPVGTLGAAASMSSYGIALWAMQQAPVATVAALRETSVLFAVLLGGWFLKEAFTPMRVIGALIMVAGIMALRLGN